MTHAAYPALRLRRTRASAWSRDLYRETVLTPSDLIWPLFVTDGMSAREPVGSLPGVERLSVDLLGERSEEHTSELQSLMRISYAVFCLKKKNTNRHKRAHTCEKQ